MELVATIFYDRFIIICIIVLLDVYLPSDFTTQTCGHGFLIGSRSIYMVGNKPPTIPKIYTNRKMFINLNISVAGHLKLRLLDTRFLFF